MLRIRGNRSLLPALIPSRRSGSPRRWFDANVPRNVTGQIGCGQAQSKERFRFFQYVSPTTSNASPHRIHELWPQLNAFTLTVLTRQKAISKSRIWARGPSSAGSNNQVL
jgi:hypothetical protein